MTVRRKYKEVPAVSDVSLSPELIRVLRPLRELALQLRDELTDNVIRREDLDALGLTDALGLKSIRTKPKRPAVLAARPVGGGTRFELDPESLNFAGFEAVEVYRSETDTYASADYVGETSGKIYIDFTGEPGSAFFYWFVARNDAGEKSEPNNIGMPATSGTFDWTGVEGSGRPEDADDDADSRAYAGLTPDGDLDRAIPVDIADDSDILRRTGGGLFAGELDADKTSIHTAADTTAVGGTAAATVRDRAASGWGLTQAGNAEKLGDARNANQVYINNVGGQLSVQPLTSADVGASTTISIAAFNIQVGSLNPSYNAGSITGLGFSVEYRVYFDDPTLAGGSPTYSATESKQTARANNGRVYIGTITTAADTGGSGPGGSGGGGDPCVISEAMLAMAGGEFKMCRYIEDGDLVLTDDGLRECENAGSFFFSPCVTLKTDSGKLLTLSSTTPITTLSGRSVRADEMLDEWIRTFDGDGSDWELVVEVADAGTREVRRLSFGGRSFAAGDRSGECLFSHNTEKP
jgi:hypothetical protein